MRLAGRMTVSWLSSSEPMATTLWGDTSAAPAVAKFLGLPGAGGESRALSRCVEETPSSVERAHGLVAEPCLGEHDDARVGGHVGEVALARGPLGDVVEALLEARERVRKGRARVLGPAGGVE